MAGRVLVGFDATRASRSALLWAVTEAGRRGARLTVVTVVDSAALAGCPPGRMAEWWRAAHDQAWRSATAGAAEAVAVAGALDVEGVAYVGSPGALLSSLSYRADLVVLGAGGRAPDSRPGPVATSVVMHAHRPVVLVGRDPSIRPGPNRPVVVGVDGSREAVPAVDVAAAIAAAAGAPLRLVCVVDPAGRGTRHEIGAYLRQDPATLAVAAQVAQVAQERARSGRANMRVTGVVVKGRAEVILEREGADAGLLVVGRRGHGAERTVVLGSVSRALMGVVRSPLAVVGWRSDVLLDSRPLRLVPDRDIAPGLPGVTIASRSPAARRPAAGSR